MPQTLLTQKNAIPSQLGKVVMHFLIDEDLPRSTGNLLSLNKHQFTDIRDGHLRRASDAENAIYAQKNKLCILTGDMGFADIRNYPPEQYYSLVVLHIQAGATSATILNLLQSFITASDIVNQIKGKLAIVEPGRVRIRKG